MKCSYPHYMKKKKIRDIFGTQYVGASHVKRFDSYYQNVVCILLLIQFLVLRCPCSRTMIYS